MIEIEYLLYNAISVGIVFIIFLMYWSFLFGRCYEKTQDSEARHGR